MDSEFEVPWSIDRTTRAIQRKPVLPPPPKRSYQVKLFFFLNQVLASDSFPVIEI